MKLRTAPDRLAVLLPWINSDAPMDERRMLKDVETFVASFDGSAEAGYVEAPAEDAEGIPDFIRKEMPRPRTSTADELDDLRVQLRLLMEQGFGEHAQLATLPGSSLRFAVRRGGERSKPTWRLTAGGNRIREGGVGAVQRYRAPGVYVMQVYGGLLDVVPFLLMHLLTQPNMVAVRRCLACGNFMLLRPGMKGRPPEHCPGGACWAITNALRKKEEQDRAEARKRGRTR